LDKSRKGFLPAGIPILFIPFTLFVILSCNDDNMDKQLPAPYPAVKKTISRHIPKATSMSEIEKAMIEAGLVDVQLDNPNIRVALQYADSNNFVGIVLYDGLTKAYLQPEVSLMLAKAQQFLTIQKPGYSLVVLDAARPRYVQQLMWDTLSMPLAEKVRFVSNPKRGSLHNYGAAVDVTISDDNNIWLDMGTAFDHIGDEAWPLHEQRMLNEGKLDSSHINNRKLLRQVMGAGGFFNIQSEWWHFNACSREQATERFQIIE